MTKLKRVIQNILNDSAGLFESLGHVLKVQGLSQSMNEGVLN